MDRSRMGSKKAADIVELASARELRADSGAPSDAKATDDSGQMPSAGALNTSAEEADPLAPEESPQDAQGISPTVLQGLNNAGDMLRVAREAFGFSVEDVAAKTNIPAARVALLEKVAVDQLPSMPFTLGFVRAYAELLNLPADALVSRFRSDAGYPSADQLPTLKPALDKDVGPPAQVSILAVLGIVAFIVWMVWQILQAVAPPNVTPVEGTPLAGRIQTDTGVTYEIDTSVADEGALVVGLPTDAPSRPSSALREEATTIADTAIRLEDGEQKPTSVLAEDTAIETQDGIDIVYTDEVVDIVANEVTASDTEGALAAAESEAARLNAEMLARLSASTPLAEVQAVAPLAGEEELPAPQSATPAQIVPTEPNGLGESLRLEAVVADAPVRVPPEIRLVIEPVYPTRCEAGASGEETVTVTFSVSRYGKVSNPEVGSSTNSCFNRAAVAAVARWDFSPAMENGRAVASNQRSTRVNFRRP
ncbi:MAG: TonB family protein [Pseudomonadota bacterium]